MRTRPLILTSEGARHPFRQIMAPHLLKVLPEPKSDDQDWKLFLLSFAAFFTCFYSFIA